MSWFQQSLVWIWAILNSDDNLSPSRSVSLPPTPAPMVAVPHPSAPSTTPTSAPVPVPPLPVTRTGTFDVLETLPHDSTAFTQGLVAMLDDQDNIVLYEGTGLYGQSELRQVDLDSGERIRWIEMSPQYFGEGIVYYEDASGKGMILQLTWREETAFVYDSENFQVLNKFQYETTNSNQGWGVTTRQDSNLAEHFVVSDGSSYLHVWDKMTFQEISRVQVFKRDSETARSAPIRRLNELEWDPNTDTILSNVWQTDTMVRIDPDSGFVTVEYDLRTLYTNRPSWTDVLNGIARVPNTDDEFFITGKKWPVMFRVRLSI